MKVSRIARAETLGLAMAGAARGICEVIVYEVKDLLAERQKEDAPAIGHVAVMENPDELRKAA